MVIANPKKLFFYIMMNMNIAKSNLQYDNFLHNYDHNYSK